MPIAQVYPFLASLLLPLIFFFTLEYMISCSWPEK